MDVLSVIVPIRNDERRIRAACLEIAHAVRPLVWDGSIDDYEIVLVDDASTDGTGESANVFAKRDRNVVVVHRDEAGGFDSAIQTGIENARGNLIAHGSARGAFAPEALRPAVEQLREEHVHTVTLGPGLARFVGVSGPSLKLIQRDPSGVGEGRLLRRSARLRGVDRPPLPTRARVGVASFAALSIAITLIAVAVLNGRVPTTRTERGAFVGRHGHVAVEAGPPAKTTPSKTKLPSVGSPQAMVVPATPRPAARAATSLISPALDSSCRTDVTNGLQAALDEAPSGSTVALHQSGCYLIGGGLTLSHLSGLTIDGAGAELRSGAISCSASSGLSLRNLVISAPDGAPAITLDGCSSIALSDVRLGGHSFGIRLTGGSQDITIDRFTARTDHAPLEISGAQRVSLDHISLTSTKAVAVAIDPAAGSIVKDIEIRNSSLTSDIGDVSAVGNGAVSYVWIHDNQLLGGRSKIYVHTADAAPSQTWWIYRNTGDVTQTLGSYITFTNVTNVLVANNDLPATVVPLRAAILFTNAQGKLSVLTNDFTGACHPFYEDARSAPVRSQGNKVSSC